MIIRWANRSSLFCTARGATWAIYASSFHTFFLVYISVFQCCCHFYSMAAQLAMQSAVWAICHTQVLSKRPKPGSRMPTANMLEWLLLHELVKVIDKSKDLWQSEPLLLMHHVPGTDFWQLLCCTSTSRLNTKQFYSSQSHHHTERVSGLTVMCHWSSSNDEQCLLLTGTDKTVQCTLLYHVLNVAHYWTAA